MGTSTGNVVNPVGTYNFINPFTLTANVNYNFQTNGFTAGVFGDFSQIKSISVNEVVTPVPEPLTIMGTILAGSLGVAIKRKQKIDKQD